MGEDDGFGRRRRHDAARRVAPVEVAGQGGQRQRAEHDAPGAVDVASGLNIAAFNVGIALGAWGGGLVVAKFGLMATPPVGAAIVAGAFLITTLAGWLDRRDGVPAKPAIKAAVATH